MYTGVILEDESMLEFDYCLICTGSKYSYPIKTKLSKNVKNNNMKYFELEIL